MKSFDIDVTKISIWNILTSLILNYKRVAYVCNEDIRQSIEHFNNKVFKFNDVLYDRINKQWNSLAWGTAIIRQHRITENHRKHSYPSKIIMKAGTMGPVWAASKRLKCKTPMSVVSMMTKGDIGKTGFPLLIKREKYGPKMKRRYIGYVSNASSPDFHKRHTKMLTYCT
jgi:hypothetical protein